MLSYRSMIWLLQSSTPSHPLSRKQAFLNLPVFAGRTYRQEMEGGGGGGAKSYDVEKAWSSVNHSIVLGETTPFLAAVSVMKTCAFLHHCQTF